MTNTPALPAGVQNLLDLHSLQAEYAGTMKYWRVMRQHGDTTKIAPRHMTARPDRFLINDDEPLDKWIKYVERFTGSDPWERI